jgi:thymidylate synthase (FAD)
MSEVKLAAMSYPVGIEGVNSAEEFIAYAARVSNPANQMNTVTASKLLKYLVKNKHWSPFEMVSLTLEIKTTRDIGRQILRHRSFSFQEFSQRYAEVNDSFEFRETRLQDQKNRQNSIETKDQTLDDIWKDAQEQVQRVCRKAYDVALQNGIAKEQARVVLPEGMTKSTMYMAGSLRSWIHYCELRMGNGTQKEHRDIAIAAWNIILTHFPSLSEVLSDETPEIKVAPGAPLFGKEEMLKVIEEWAKDNIPPIPPDWKEKLRNPSPPAAWDAQGGKPMIPGFKPVCSNE